MGWQILDRVRVTGIWIGFGLTMALSLLPNAPGDILERLLPSAIHCVTDMGREALNERSGIHHHPITACRDHHYRSRADHAVLSGCFHGRTANLCGCAAAQHRRSTGAGAACLERGTPIVTRGGGMSYTSGYIASAPDSVLIDMASMDAIVEVNLEDRYVTVEAGCSWQKLYEHLAPLGVRTAYWGTLSGRYATVGGGLSQNSIFWGSGQSGTAR